MNHSETITIECTINGMPFQLHAAPGTPLSELLREQGLLSVKQGCCVGECGACTCNFAFFSGLFDAQFWAGSAQPKSPELTANY